MTGSDAAHRPRIKKIPPELRRPINLIRPAALADRLRYDSQFLRSAVQWAFMLLVVWIGIEFHYFVTWGTSSGGRGFVGRPPGVEGFLPISALMSLLYWIDTGIINSIHPSGLFIFGAVIVLGVTLKKSFCSWLCPIGTLSEGLWELGRRLFGRNPKLPRVVDIPMRGMKYLLLGFFLYAVLSMDVEALRLFIYSPYNRVADVKMYYFFASLSPLALTVILALVVLSMVIKNFWCRYLCPYGALLGILSLLSPLKITRNRSTCIDCELCTKACPASIPVHTLVRVRSDECMSCMKCVQVCPVTDTLEMRLGVSKARVSPLVFTVLVVGVFVGVTGFAMMAGHWQNSISKEEYSRRLKEIDKPQYNHFQGHVPDYGPND